MNRQARHRFRIIASPLIGLLSALAVAPAALGQNRYLDLTWVDRSGEVISVIGEPGEYRGLEVSPDGDRVVFHRHVGNGGEVWLIDADGDGEATRLVADATGVQDNAHPIFSPDGGRIVYASLRDGIWGLYGIDADGRGEEELLHTSGRTMVPTSWSPDGRFIVFWENTGFEWVLPLEGDRTPFRLMDGPSSHSQISPDGRWVAYLSSGDIWLRGFPDGAEVWQVSDDGGVFPRWRADGRELYYMNDGFLGIIMAAGIEAAGDAIEISGPSAVLASEYVNLGHTGIYHTFAVSPDGERFLIPRPEPDSLVVIDRERGETDTVGRMFALFPSLSPDGTRAVALAGDRGFWVTDVASGERWEVGAIDALQVFAASVAWSPDGDRVAWLLGKPRGDTLHIARADGEGEPETVATLPGVGGQLIGFSPDGQSVLYYSAQLGGNVIFRLPLDSDEGLTELVRFDTPMNAPRVSPDGRLIAYHTGNLNRDEVWVRSLEFSGDEAPPPVSAGQGLGMVSWRDDGSELFYVSPEREVVGVEVQAEPAIVIGTPRRLFEVPEFPQAQGNFNGVGDVSIDGTRALFAVPPPNPPLALNEIRVVDRSGRVIAKPGEPGLHGGRPILSPDGTRVAAGLLNLETNTTELWLYDLVTGESRLRLSTRNLNSWIWSEDGEEIVYAIMDFADPEGGAIYRAPAFESGSQELLYRHYPGTGFNLIDWSADGRFVLFMSGGVLHVLPLDREAGPVELIREEFSVGQALLSPDNRFVAFSSDETEPGNAWLWSFDPEAIALGPASDKLQLSTDGAGGPLSWGRDGREVTYRNAGAITSVEISASGDRAQLPQALFREPEGAGNASASRNGERWVFYAPAVSER